MKKEKTKEKKRPVGRPPMPAKERRDHFVKIRMNEEGIKELKKKLSGKMSISKYFFGLYQKDCSVISG